MTRSVIIVFLALVFVVLTASAGIEAKKHCKKTLASCPINGCAQPGTDHAIFNEQKRKIPGPGNPIDLSFADLHSLQSQTDQKVGQQKELTQAQRDSLSNLTVSHGTVREGSLVRVVGFIAQGLDPHPNTGESVNCGLTGPADNDFHIPLAEHVTDSDFNGIVVEMIPQGRSSEWSLVKLIALKSQGKEVLVVGALFYDNEHAVNRDPTHKKKSQPARFALWEVHPIIDFRVCNKASNNCNPDVATEWTKLETLTP